MSFSASCSASLGSSSLVFVSGVAMSVNLQLHVTVLDRGVERLHGDVGGERLGAAGSQVEQRTVARALHGAGAGIELALGERAVVVRAPVLDRVQLAVGSVEHADLAAIGLDEAHLPFGEVLQPANDDRLVQILGCTR